MYKYRNLNCRKSGGSWASTHRIKVFLMHSVPAIRVQVGWKMESGGVVSSPPSLSGVRVTGVQADLRRRGLRLTGRGAVQGLSAPTEVLQWLQEGPTRTLFLHRGGALLLYLGNLGESDGLGLEAGFTSALRPAPPPGGALGHRQLLRKLFHRWGQ